MLPLVLYDIPSKLPGDTWSPNPAKSRFVLGYKNLPFTTTWVEYPDIAPTLKEIGALPTKRLDGTEQYTLPVLSDPNTSAMVSDSWDIAEYLDATYPEKPIFPKDSKGVIKAFESAVIALQGDSERLTYLRTRQIVNGRSLEYFTTTREAGIGETIDRWSPEGPMRDTHWAIIEKCFLGSAKTWYEKVEGRWLMGNTFSYADIVFAARLFWFKRIFQDNEWQRIASLHHNGKWGELLADVEKECDLIME